MENKLFIIKYKYPILIITVLLVLFSIPLLLNSNINSDLESYLPDSMQEKVNNDSIEKIFGKSDPIIIVFENKDILQEKTLIRIKKIEDEFSNSSNFEILLSLFNSKNIKGEHGAMVVEDAIEQIPKNIEERNKLAENLKNNELVYKRAVSADFKHCIIILNALHSNKDKELIKEIQEIIKNNPGNEKVSIFGQAYLRYEANQKILRDLLILLPIAMFMMCLFLWFSFKEKRGVILPISAVVASCLISMALISVFGWEISIIGVLIPIMMIAVTNDYGIHIIIKYQELNAEDNNLSMEEIVKKTFLFLKKPIIITGLTTIAGVAGLLTHIMIPAKQMGIVSSIGIAFALLMSLTFIPAFMLFLKKGKARPHFSPSPNNFFNKFLNNIGNFITKKAKTTVIGFAIISVIFAAGIFNLKIAADFNNILPENHSYNKALRTVNKHFGGTKYISIYFEGDIKSPELLNKLNFYESELRKLPETGDINSMASIIRIMSKAIYEPGEEFYNKIPQSRNGVSQLIELYNMSSNPEDFEKIVDFDYSKTIMTIQYNARNMSEINEITDKIEELTKNDPDKKIIGGYSLVEKELSNAVTIGQKNSLLFAFFVIIVLLIIIFRSLYAGLLGSIPLAFSVILTFGIMGIAGIELNIVTALLSSISIGIGVDYTIHIFWRIKAEIAQGNTTEAAVKKSLNTTGKGIIINAFSVILGFSVLFISAFPLIRAFAFLIVISLFLCLVSALVLVPALIILLKPAFLNKKITN